MESPRSASIVFKSWKTTEHAIQAVVFWSTLGGQLRIKHFLKWQRKEDSLSTRVYITHHHHIFKDAWLALMGKIPSVHLRVLFYFVGHVNGHYRWQCSKSFHTWKKGMKKKKKNKIQKTPVEKNNNKALFQHSLSYAGTSTRASQYGDSHLSAHTKHHIAKLN